MNKCSPMQMRKNLASVEAFKEVGIDFVAIPVKDEAHRMELICQGQAIFDDLVKESES